MEETEQVCNKILRTNGRQLHREAPLQQAKLFSSACILHASLTNTPSCNGKIIRVTLMPVNLETSAYPLTVGKSCCDEESPDVVQSAPPEIRHLLFGGGVLSE